MIVAWTFIKLFAKGALSFVAKHWRIILPLLILWYCYAQYNKQVVRAEAAEKAFYELQNTHDDYIADIAKEKEKREAENKIKEENAKADLAESEAKNNVLAKLNLDRERETKNLKDLYANEKRINRINANTANRLRIESTEGERGDVGMSDTSTDTIGLAETERNSDRAYSTLEKACQITTSDYNRLRGWADVACKQVGCK